MIQMHYTGKPYDYGKDIGSQNYSIQTDITINEDATGTDVVRALVDIMRLASYNDTVIKDSLQNVLDELNSK